MGSKWRWGSGSGAGAALAAQYLVFEVLATRPAEIEVTCRAVAAQLRALAELVASVEPGVSCSACMRLLPARRDAPTAVGELTHDVARLRLEKIALRRHVLLPVHCCPILCCPLLTLASPALLTFLLFALLLVNELLRGG